MLISLPTYKSSSDKSSCIITGIAKPANPLNKSPNPNGDPLLAPILPLRPSLPYLSYIERFSESDNISYASFNFLNCSASPPLSG